MEVENGASISDDLAFGKRIDESVADVILLRADCDSGSLSTSSSHPHTPIPPSQDQSVQQVSIKEFRSSLPSTDSQKRRSFFYNFFPTYNWKTITTCFLEIMITNYGCNSPDLLTPTNSSWLCLFLVAMPSYLASRIGLLNLLDISYPFRQLSVW